MKKLLSNMGLVQITDYLNSYTESSKVAYRFSQSTGQMATTEPSNRMRLGGGGEFSIVAFASIFVANNSHSTWTYGQFRLNSPNFS